MAFSEMDINEIYETTLVFPQFTQNDDEEIVEAYTVLDAEGSDIHSMPLVITLSRETEYSTTTAIYQLVDSNKEFKRDRIGNPDKDN